MYENKRALVTRNGNSSGCEYDVLACVPDYDVHVLERMLRYIRERRLLSAGDRVAVAVSGGADSVALLRALLEAREQLGIVVSVAHVNHMLRGEDADSDEQFVQALAREFAVEFHVERVDVAKLASERKISLETAGREARYAFFARLVESGAADKVATAHTADDQSETVLMKFLRGAGTRGISGIHPSVSLDSRTRIVRPLLATSRAEVEQYLRALGQTWQDDSTNSSTEFLRNRVRHELIPLLREFNPQLATALSNTAEIARAEEDYWRSLVTPSVASIASLGELQQMPLALRRRVVRALAESHGAALEFDDVERCLEFLGSRSAGVREISDGLALVVNRAACHLVFRFENVASTVAADFSVPLTIPGSVAVPERNSIFSAALSAEVPFGRGLTPELAGRTLLLRNWRAGDRFQPAGRGADKLKRFFQEYRIASSDRAAWPIAELDGDIVWVLGMPVAQSHVARGTQAIVIEETAVS